MATDPNAEYGASLSEVTTERKNQMTATPLSLDDALKAANVELTKAHARLLNAQAEELEKKNADGR